MASQNAGDDDSEIEEIPSTSGPVALLPERSLRAAPQRQQPGLTVTTEIKGAAMIQNLHLLGTGNTHDHSKKSKKSKKKSKKSEGAAKKRKIIEASNLPGFVHLGGDTYVNLDAPITNHARVYEGEQRSTALGPEIIAIKLLSINTVEEAKPLKDEALAIRDNPHQNVVRYISADFNTEKFMCMYLAMEMCRKINLHVHVMEMRGHGRKFSFADCMSVARQLSSALEHLHKKEILHRDIKPSNVLFSKDGCVLKLTDFSLVKPVRPGRSVTADSSKRIGTDGWRAPEVYIRYIHGKKSDVFSLGLLLNFVWSNGEQAYGSDPDLNNFNIKTNRNRDLSKLRFENPDEPRQLLEMMLQFDERIRISAADVSSHDLCRNADDKLENPEGELIRSPVAAATGDAGVVEGHCIIVFDRITSMMHAFSPSTKAWGHMQSLSEEMTSWNMTVVSAGEYIYALSETRRVFRIKYTDPNAIWENEDDMLLKHGGLPSSTFLGGFIYAIGGSQWFGGSEYISKEGERLELATGEWSRIPDMETNRKVHSVVACNNCVYSIGGRDSTLTISVGGQAEGADVRGEKFNPITKEWTPIAPMNGARHAAFATALGDKIYILGGWRRGNRLSEAECYDTNTDVWTMIKKMNVPRSYLSAVTVEGRVYAVNGDNESPVTIEEYDPENDSWRIVDRMENMTIWSGASAAIYMPSSNQAN